jgi:hypothetical protein
MLKREKQLQEQTEAERKKETDLKSTLQEFAAVISSNLKHMPFEHKQKLLRMVLDKVVVTDWRVDLYYNIPLPVLPPPTPQAVSTKFDLRSTCTTLCQGPDYAQ